MEANLKNNTNELEKKMDGMTQTMREEMQCMGHGLQAGIMAISCSKTRTASGDMATPRAGSSELKGCAPAGEDRAIRETCWARRVKVTETVTQGEKLIGVTETCTRHVETREITREETELTVTRETVEERLHGVEVEKDAHTHTHTQR